MTHFHSQRCGGQEKNAKHYLAVVILLNLCSKEGVKVLRKMLDIFFVCLLCDLWSSITIYHEKGMSSYVFCLSLDVGYTCKMFALKYLSS